VADNVAITAGAGTTIATDDCGAGGHTQVVKLAIATNGSATFIPADATDGLQVNLAGNNDVTATGNVAHDAADSGNPIKVGAKAVAFGATPTAVAAADRTDLYANRHGIQFVIGGHPNAKSSVYLRTDAATDDNILPAIGAGNKYAITRISVSLDEAATVGVACTIGFGTANVPALPATGADAVDDVLFYHPGMVPGTVYTVGDGHGILGVGADGAELRITSEVPTGGTLGVVVTWFPIES
jgi:hypothetical protein